MLIPKPLVLMTWPHMKPGSLQMTKLRWGHQSGSRSSMICILIRGGKRPRHSWGTLKTAGCTEANEKQCTHPPFEPSERAGPCQPRAGDFWPHNFDRINFCYFKLPNSWWFVMAAPRNEQFQRLMWPNKAGAVGTDSPGGDPELTVDSVSIIPNCVPKTK